MCSKLRNKLIIKTSGITRTFMTDVFEEQGKFSASRDVFEEQGIFSAF